MVAKPLCSTCIIPFTFPTPYETYLFSNPGPAVIARVNERNQGSAQKFASSENNLQMLGRHLLLCISLYPLHPFLVISSHLLGHDGVGIAADTHVGSGIGRAVREGVGTVTLSLGVLVTRQGCCREGVGSRVKERQQ